MLLTAKLYRRFYVTLSIPLSTPSQQGATEIRSVRQGVKLEYECRLQVSAIVNSPGISTSWKHR